MALLVLFSAACGGSAVEWAGKWRQPLSVPPGFSIEGFSFAQGDANHLTLQNPQRTVKLVRE